MMFNKARNIRDKYIEEKMYPSIFCVGCGNGNVLNYALRAIDELDLDIDKVVFASGIGCSSRLPGYIDADGLHTTHGRAIAFATGIKTAQPDLTVIIFTGDGDLAGIGGNHFIHAARRNVDLTVIALNNFNYGMTGGQVSPTTPSGGYTTTSPFGNIEEVFDLSELAIISGAPYVARWPLGYPYETVKSIKKGILNKGFSFIEMLVPCPTGYGRKNQLREIKANWEWYKKNTILNSKYRILEEKQKDDNKKIVIGELQNIERKEFTFEWANLVKDKYVE
jgi:2-oxoglutarate ferredoxin oxidoreductase subunit beta